MTATIAHGYAFDASDVVSGSYAVTVTDRATNTTGIPFYVVRDAIAPAAAIRDSPAGGVEGSLSGSALRS